MTIVSINHLGDDDISMLGNNIASAVRRHQRRRRSAYDHHRERQYRRASCSRLERLRNRKPVA